MVFRHWLSERIFGTHQTTGRKLWHQHQELFSPAFFLICLEYVFQCTEVWIPPPFDLRTIASIKMHNVCQMTKRDMVTIRLLKTSSFNSFSSKKTHRHHQSSRRKALRHIRSKQKCDVWKLPPSKLSLPGSGHQRNPRIYIIRKLLPNFFNLQPSPRR